MNGTVNNQKQNFILTYLIIGKSSSLDLLIMHRNVLTPSPIQAPSAQVNFEPDFFCGTQSSLKISLRLSFAKKPNLLLRPEYAEILCKSAKTSDSTIGRK